MAIDFFSSTNPLKGVLIDLDGTLIDHFQVLYDCYKHVTTTMSLPVPTQDQVKRAVGGSMPVTMKQLIPEANLETATSLWRTHFDSIYLDNVEYMPGATQLLEVLKSKDIPAAVFTNKIGIHARGLCDKLDATRFLKFVLGAEDTLFRKPQIEFSQHALSQLGTVAEQTLMVGDSPFDIEAAKCVGMISATVPTGSHTHDELVEANTDQVFPSLHEIASSIEQLDQ